MDGLTEIVCLFSGLFIGWAIHNMKNSRTNIELVTQNQKLLLEVKFLREQAAISSWEGDVDRQSGAFTQEEIDNSTRWR